MDFLSGRILAFDKPYKMTSFGVVGRVRRLLTQKMNGRKIRVGHAGTLDPLATGVLILCTGRATKQIESLQKDTKEYIAELRLGETTPSFDLEHPVDKTFPTAHITAESFEEAVRKFEGDILQVPPVFSACKVNGDRAYDLARKGRDVQLAAKPIRIEKIESARLRAASHRLRKRYLHSVADPRHRRSIAKRGAYDVSTAHTSWRHQRRKLLHARSI